MHSFISHGHSGAKIQNSKPFKKIIKIQKKKIKHNQNELRIQIIKKI